VPGGLRLAERAVGTAAADDGAAVLRFAAHKTLAVVTDIPLPVLAGRLALLPVRSGFPRPAFTTKFSYLNFLGGGEQHQRSN